jgi:hypothetical protein
LYSFVPFSSLPSPSSFSPFPPSYPNFSSLPPDLQRLHNRNRKTYGLNKTE